MKSRFSKKKADDVFEFFKYSPEEGVKQIKESPLGEQFCKITMLAMKLNGGWISHDEKIKYPLPVKAEEYSGKNWRFLEFFIEICRAFKIINAKSLKSESLYLEVSKEPLVYELSCYWGSVINREDGKTPIDAMCIFFYSCIIRGEWKFYYCEKELNKLPKPEPETVSDTSNVYNFSDYKKKVS